MSTEWPLVSLKEIGSLARGKSRHRPRYDPVLYEGEYPFVQTGDVKIANRYITTYDQTYNDVGLAQSRLWPQGTLCITIAANIAETAILGIDACFPDSVVGFTAKTDRCDTLYVFYYLQNYKREIQKLAYGTVQDNINLSTFDKVYLPLPPLAIQRRITDILGSLDDKIELNRRMNETLEQMAMALYKHWFVDFGPFQDGEFVGSELGMIPKGWELADFLRFSEILGGGTPKTSVDEYWNGSTPWISVKDLQDIFVLITEKTITEKGLQNSSARLIPEFSSIISARGTVGEVSLISKPMAMNQSCYALHSTVDAPWFTYLTLRMAVDRLKRNSHGSVFSTITRDTLLGEHFPYNHESTMLFERIVSPWFEQILSNLRENELLSETRNYLLPRLLSGEIELNVAKEQVEEVV